MINIFLTTSCFLVLYIPNKATSVLPSSKNSNELQIEVSPQMQLTVSSPTTKENLTNISGKEVTSFILSTIPVGLFII
ncbi:hypothetical protein ACWN7Y_01790 [Vagococcus fluvialis]|uniref:hypothetical protein n=1 Tax=Vagococcus fluvialis TaxID=2738 RepID=UPI000F865A0A|nr:hypothetical protein [Vagococcus fluvialis]